MKKIKSRHIQKKIQNYAATCFQKKVWLALCQIPAGETRSYQEIALAIGKPKAFRAVANAIAKNPFLIEVPCHRVIRKDGQLGGYSGPGGTEMKKQLLEKETCLQGI